MQSFPFKIDRDALNELLNEAEKRGFGVLEWTIRESTDGPSTVCVKFLYKKQRTTDDIAREFDRVAECLSTQP